MTKLTDKVAIVTGAGSGMGKAIAIAYANAGAKVVLADVNEQTLAEVEQEITGNGGQVLSCVTDISKEKDIDNLIKATTDKFGSLNILVNNAGIMDSFQVVGNVSNEQWNKVMAIDLEGPFKTARAAIKVMEKQDNGGVIINNASVGGLFGGRGGAVYTIAKHGLVGLTKNIAATYGRFGKIRANAIAPGGVKTNISSTIKQPDPLGGQAVQAAGQPPLGEPEQIAALALFLAGDEASFLNGDIVKADGGWTV
ncbi:SDR family oxidoreductase [Ligilactobacillus acidipiscis]|uniref:SDR family oxidoreductase n=1 Tax=Ligilactobacillus acidipiscis TaxID=89059 RepID=UPI0023F6DCAB|nr:SDR family oxidoreductase [Ligilactobacillus acidipiscis]WEV57145.1 SDR family oxidoreductase [Ligilactobacillus acidipiscis]